jgi:hypothetical protein
VGVVATCGLLALLAPGAPAATVVNGNFESGNLSGWVSVEPPESDGGWFAYSGTNAPISKGEMEPIPRTVIAPPQGNFAAISDEDGPGTHILYQDVALEPGMTHSLSLLVYYQSEEPITVPSPDTLSDAGADNQQYRIDVMRPTAPIDSVNPADILTTVYRTLPGAPLTVTPTPASVDLTPFAGQTVRLRLAEVDNLFFFNAGADAVSISSVPINIFTFGQLTLNKKKGTGQLVVNVPGPGTVTAVDASSSTAKSASASKKKKKKPALIKKTTVTVTAPGIATLDLKPTSAGKKKLKEKGKLAFKVSVTFTPTGGTAATQTFMGKLKLTPRKKR